MSGSMNSVDEDDLSDPFEDFLPLADTNATPPPEPSAPRRNRRIAFVEDVTSIVEEVLRSRTGDSAASSSHHPKSDSKPSTTPKGKGRSLVVCIDGTANQFGLTNTNVVELFSRLVADEDQLLYYNSGIATYVTESNILFRAKQKVNHWLDLAFAFGHEEITLKAYQWLSENYVDGDRIYLFGFSRGAYQVRIISGMLKTVGLLRKGNNEQIRFAYQLYLATIKVEERRESMAKPLSGGRIKKFYKISKTTLSRVWKSSGAINPSEQDPTSELCDQFKKTLSHADVKVHFVGVWDTVSSIGITRGPSFPETTTGMTHVRALRHAISLHELRGKFLPEFANGGLGPLAEGDVKEVWFAGSHSDIGGGNVKNLRLNSFGPPLRWMLYEAMENGLRVRPYKGTWGEVRHTESMKHVWWLFELIPFKRLSYDGKDRNAVTRWPHLAAGRRIQKGQLIHESAIEFLQKHPEHRTKAQIMHNGSWVALEDRLDSLGDDVGIEQDFHAGMVGETIKRLADEAQGTQSLSRELAEMLLRLVSNSVAQRSFIDSLVTAEDATTALSALQMISEASPQILAAADQAKIGSVLCSTLYGFTSRPADCGLQSSSTLAHWLRFTEYIEVSNHVINTFGSHTPSGHSSSVLSVAYSPDGKHVVSGSADNTIRLWDAETRYPVGNPFLGHTDEVWSVVFSPDGRRIASASGDGTIRVWDVASQKSIGSPLVGHLNWVASVAFHPNGNHIVSGSRDETIRIWDAMTGLTEGRPLVGHTSLVRSVAFSPDGNQVVSGSRDNTVRIWDTSTHEVIRVFEGHPAEIRSVVFMPDGKRVVSGSRDHTVRVWDVESGETILGPLSRSTGEVNSVAVSPDGKYIASGTDDEAICLWNATRGDAVGEPKRLYTGLVNSVAFSPDGRHIVSGTYDSTLKFWDLDVPNDIVS